MFVFCLIAPVHLSHVSKTGAVRVLQLLLGQRVSETKVLVNTMSILWVYAHVGRIHSTM